MLRVFSAAFSRGSVLPDFCRPPFSLLLVARASAKTLSASSISLKPISTSRRSACTAFWMSAGSTVLTLTACYMGVSFEQPAKRYFEQPAGPGRGLIMHAGGPC